MLCIGLLCFNSGEQMSYIRADRILPRELLEAIQQYVDGKAIYIPSKQKKAWGSDTNTRSDLSERNRQIHEAFQAGETVEMLAERHSLTVKSVQRIIRRMKGSEAERGT